MTSARFLSALATLAIAVAAACSAAAQDAPAPQQPPAPPPTTGPRKITIVHTNDLHAHIENFAVVAGVAKRELARNPKASLFLDGGDCITGTPVSTIWQGMPIFEILNSFGFTAACIGNHEYDHGWKRVHEFTETATYPLLCANVKDPDGKPFGDAPHRVFEIDGVKIGVLGLTAGDLRRLTAKQATEGCQIEAPLDTAKRLVPELRKQADMIVLLTHIGVENDAAIAGAVSGIDLVVGAHSHTRLDKHLTVNGARIVQAWEYGKAVGVIDLTWDPAERKITEFASKLILTSEAGLPRDPAVQKLVDHWQAKADEIVGVKIGVTDQDLSKKELRPRIERLYRDALGCDAGFQNTGGIRDIVRKGDIMIRDVWNVLPFDNTMVKVKIPGARLPEWAKRQIGGAIDDARIYTIATNSYCTDHMKDNFGADDFEVEDTGLLMRDVAVKWVKEHGGFDPGGKPLAGTAPNAPAAPEKK